MLQNEGDAYKNITTFFLAYVTDEEFKEIGGENCLYQVRYEGNDSSEFRKAVNERYLILIVMPLIVVVLVSIVIKRKVQSEQKHIGTLTALGYTKGRVMLHYAGFAVIPGILGGALGVLLLNGNSEQGEKSYRKMLAKKKISFRIKYAVRSLIGNQGRTFVVYLGIFLGSYIALLGFGILDTMENTKENMVDEILL